MKNVRRFRFAASPLVLAVALGLLGPDVLGEEEDENTQAPSAPPVSAAEVPPPADSALS